MTRTFYLLAAITISLLLMSLRALAQQVTVTPGDRFGWEMTGALPLVQSYRYELELDGQIQRAALSDVTCVLRGVLTSDGEVIDCTAPIPVTTLGPHRVRVRPSDISVPGLPAIEGAWSPVLHYVMRPMPPAPAKIRAVKSKGTP